MSDLAKSVAPVSPNVATSHTHEADEKSINAVVAVLSSRVETRVKSSEEAKLPNGPDETAPGTPTEHETRVYMTATRVNCNIAFGELAHNLPASHAAKSVTVLVDMLKDIPYIDFEPSLAWDGERSFICRAHSDIMILTCFCGVEWSLPDQLVFSTVSALLKITSAHLESRSVVMEAIVNFSLSIVKQLESDKRE